MDFQSALLNTVVSPTNNPRNSIQITSPGQIFQFTSPNFATGVKAGQNYVSQTTKNSMVNDSWTNQSADFTKPAETAPSIAETDDI